MDGKKPLFTDLNAEVDDQETSHVESVCLNCGENGTTSLLLTKIPFYREIVLMSFSCPHCGYKNNETQFGGRIQEEGAKMELIIQTPSDLNRQIVKSDFASVFIPEVELEIPSQTQKGELTTVEGIINRVIEGLQANQSTRQEENSDVATKIDIFITKLQKLKNLENSFHLILDDPSGNSCIENPFAPHKDTALTITKYKRTEEQHVRMGFKSESEDPEVFVPDEVAVFQTNCYACNSPCETRMKPTKIPHFKEVVIMATNCDFCGHKSTEVKPGSGIEPKGTRIELHVSTIRDLHRDVLKSDTCAIKVPELDLEVGAGALSGRFTTVEGLFDAMAEQLKNSMGDGTQSEIKSRLSNFVKELQEVQSGGKEVHVILDDPAGNSYVEGTESNDDKLKIIHYERTFEQNEELGINDINTENY